MNDRQRLEAIVAVVCKYLPPDGISREEAMSQIIGLVDPLPAQPEQEPVAWVESLEKPQPRCVTNLNYRSVAEVDAGVQYIPLYTATPEQWVGLTNEEVDAIRNNIFEKYKKALFVTRDVTSENDYSAFNFYRAIEEKLRSKNDF